MADNHILDSLSQYATSGQTGTLMIVFSDNSIGRFYLAGGLLATARYRNREGQEAFELAKQVGINNVRFHENADLVRSGELIDGVTLPAASPAPAATAAPAAASGPLLTHVMRAGISELLAEYIGPVASVVMADLPGKVSVDSAIDQLSSEITDAGQAAAFVRAAKNIVNS